MDSPSYVVKGEHKLDKKYNLYFAAMIIIAVIATASVAGVILYYQGKVSTQKNGRVLATLVDDTGYVLNLTSYPKRIVSLAPSCTQDLFAVGAGNFVVGVDQYSDIPYNFTAWIQAGNMSCIGSFMNPAVEPIVTLKPDLVLASSGSLSTAASLRQLGINVLTLDPSDLGGMLSDLILVGRATNHEAQAASLVSSLEQSIQAIENKLASATTTPRVYYEDWSNPLMTQGAGTFITTLISLAGGQNIFGNATSTNPIVSPEAVISLNPDMIIFPSSMGVSNFWGTYSDVASRPGWNTINAVKTNSFYTIDGDIINQPGPSLVNALEQLAQIIHPDLFGNYTETFSTYAQNGTWCLTTSPP
jgi:iron complex transport system substrate-binding protein